MFGNIVTCNSLKEKIKSKFVDVIQPVWAYRIKLHTSKKKANKNEIAKCKLNRFIMYSMTGYIVGNHAWTKEYLQAAYTSCAADSI